MGCCLRRRSMTEIKRLSRPHGSCTSIDAFQDKYGIKYTRQVRIKKICQKICLLEQIWADCHCFDSSTLMLNKLVNIPQDIPPCLREQDKACMAKQKHIFQKSNEKCKCNNPCQEIQYRKIVSSRQWPNPDFAKIIISSLCKKSQLGRCERLKNKNDEERRNEFVKLNIFYEDLNYERFEESPDYEGSQFLSDIGGTIGLWIGLSLLSLFEIFHLVVHIIIMYFFPHWKKSFGKRYKYKVHERL